METSCLIPQWGRAQQHLRKGSGFFSKHSCSVGAVFLLLMSSSTCLMSDPFTVSCPSLGFMVLWGKGGKVIKLIWWDCWCFPPIWLVWNLSKNSIALNVDPEQLFLWGNTSLSWVKHKRPWLAKQIQCTLNSIVFHCGKDGIDFVVTR